MVAQLLRLKLQLTLNAFRRSPWRLVGLVLAIALGVWVVVLASTGLVALRTTDPEVTRNLLVLVGSVIVLGFIVLPLVFGVDDQLDPRAFSLYGLPNRTLSAGLIVAALVSVPSIVLAVLAASSVVTWSRSPLPAVLAVMSAVLGVLLCALLARIATSISASLLSTRRAKEVMGVLGLVLIIAVSPAIIALTTVDWQRDGFAVLGRVADILSWTPLGAVWSFPGDAAIGDIVPAVVKLLLTAATIALLWFAWQAFVARLLVAPERIGTGRESTGLGWFDLLPGRPAGVIAARSMTYWLRDPRYLVSLVIIPIAPFIFFVPLLVAGIPLNVLALVPLPVVCWFLGWLLHNDLAFDSTAVWLHVASGVRGRADRIGRLFPVLLIGIPLIAVGSTLSILFYGDWDALPSMIGVSTCLLLSGAGIASFVSARFPYPTSLPGDSPFQQPQVPGSSGLSAQFMSLLGTVVLTVPAAWLAVLGLTGEPNWNFGALAVGVGTGLLVLVIGILAGGRVFDRRSPEIVGFASSH
ncbi:hypothetical protein [Plantibacter sp. ME-Dv--P-095]|uniref:hypothetical protein n=1 Tax=Plantibacter sp. ME-Dv--P-095 TaxID=3040299 RepID=UPI00254D9AF1|nr:hypothetical protein [Plantibacter sp. ME-Dv--P-095]